MVEGEGGWRDVRVWVSGGVVVGGVGVGCGGGGVRSGGERVM